MLYKKSYFKKCRKLSLFKMLIIASLLTVPLQLIYAQTPYCDVSVENSNICTEFSLSQIHAVRLITPTHSQYVVEDCDIIIVQFVFSRPLSLLPEYDIDITFTPGSGETIELVDAGSFVSNGSGGYEANVIVPMQTPEEVIYVEEFTFRIPQNNSANTHNYSIDFQEQNYNNSDIVNLTLDVSQDGFPSTIGIPNQTTLLSQIIHSDVGIPLPPGKLWAASLVKSLIEQNNPFIVEGTLIIDQDHWISVLGNHIVMGEGAEIVINPGVSLVFMDLTGGAPLIISGCDKMWKGITIKEGGALRFIQDPRNIVEPRYIRDAEYAIRFDGSPGWQNTDISDIVFEDNYVGIYAHQAFSIPPGSPMIPCCKIIGFR